MTVVSFLFTSLHESNSGP